MSIVSEKTNKFECRAIMKYLYLKGLWSKKIFDDVVNTLYKACPSYATVKNWIGS